MTGDAAAAGIVARYGLADVPRVSDPGRALYRTFGLHDATREQLVSRAVLARGAEAWRAGHRAGWPRGNPLQMPGMFLVYRGEIADSFRHATIADRPDYVKFVRGG